MIKKITIMSVALFAGATTLLKAQTNLNFENWTGINPTSWATSNGMTQAGGGAQTVFKVSDNPGQGSFSVRMVTGSCPTCEDFSILGPFGPPTPLPNPLGGSVELGTFEEPGIPYTLRPISVDFRYKANPGNNDACGFQVELTRYNAATEEDETIGEGYFEVSTDVPNWTSVNIPIVYYSNLTPDRLNIWATSSIGSVPDLSAFGFPDLPVPTPVAGSEFFIDAIVLNLPSCDGFSISTSSIGESSIGANNGSATVTPQGGTAPYTYNWSNLETTQTINNLVPGYYVVTVTDANQCQKVSTIYVAPAGCNLTANITGTNSSSNSIFSGNGTATVNASGGNPPYSYEWNTGATSTSINNLAVGTYSVVVTEVNNPECFVWTYFTVFGPAGGPVSTEELPVVTNEGLTVFPNPTDGLISFNSKSDIREIQIVNTLGETVYFSRENSGLVNVDLSDRAAGIYTYKIKNEDGAIMSGRVIVK